MKLVFNQKIPIPKTKSIGVNIDQCLSVNEARAINQKFLYFKRIVGETYIVGYKKRSTDGAHFLLNDLNLNDNKVGW